MDMQTCSYVLPNDVFEMIKSNVKDLEFLENHKKKMKVVHKDLVKEYNYLREENILHEYLNLSDSYDDAVVECHNDGIDPMYDNDAFNALERLVNYHKEYIHELESLGKRYNYTRIGDMMLAANMNVEDYYDVYFRAHVY